MSNILQISPFLHVPDMALALDLFTRVLCFELKFRSSDYAYLEWGNAALRLLQEPGRAVTTGAKRRITVFIDVADVDILYAELQEGLRRLPDGDVHPPLDQPWGQRELHVRLPDGDWLSFSQAVATPASNAAESPGIGADVLAK